MRTMQFNTKQRKAMNSVDQTNTLKSFISKPEGKLLAVKEEFLFIIPAWQDGFDPIDLDEIAIAVDTLYPGERELFFTNRCDRSQYEKVLDWLLDSRRRYR